MQEQNQDLVPYQTDEQVQYSYPVYTDEYRRRPGSGFGGIGRPGYGYGRPGYGAPFLGGVVGGLIGSSLLYPPYYYRPRPYPYPYYPYPYYPYYPYYGYGYGYGY